MSRRFAVYVLSAALGLVLAQAREARPNQGTQSSPSADPYANNPNAGTTKFPLAPPAGKDSGAVTKPLPGGINQGPIDEKSWKYGRAFDAPANSKIWNPVKLKMMRGDKVTG